MTQNNHKRYTKHLPMAVGALLVVVVGIALVWLINGLKENAHTPKRTAQQITLIQPPPPPPPPPEKVEPPPEPEIKEEVKMDEPPPEEAPEEASDEPPPGEDLALDAEGGAGGDAFGLVGKKGGRSLLGGTGGDKFAWYAGSLKQYLNDALNEKEKLRERKYSIQVKIWIESDGKIKRVKLVGTTGSAATDEALKEAFAALGKVNELPPEEMQQPIRLRITSRS